MSWPAVTASAILSGEGIKTLGITLFDRDSIAASMSWTIQTTANNFTTTLQDEHNLFVRLPVWAEATAVITMTFVARRAVSVSGNANFRLRGREIGGSFVNGSTLNTALTDSVGAPPDGFQPYEVTLTVPASPSWAGVVVEFGFQAQRPASGGDSDWKAGMSQVCANMRVVPISP